MRCVRHVSSPLRCTFSQATDTFEYYATEHFRLSGVYWGATALYLMGRLDALDAQAIVDWVMSCQHPCGGFGGSERHDPHLLYTLSAVQILALYDRMDLLDKDRVATCTRCMVAGGFTFSFRCGVAPATGWFLYGRHLGGSGHTVHKRDQYAQVHHIHHRFSYCALSCCALLGRLDALDVPAAVAFINACRNFDGSYGCAPGNESHAGQVFTCVGALAVAGAVADVHADLLAWWYGPTVDVPHADTPL